MSKKATFVLAVAALAGSCTSARQDPTATIIQCTYQPDSACVEAAKKAINGGANVSFVDEQGLSLFLLASRGIDPAVAETRKEEGRPLRANDERDQEASIALLKALVSAKADIFATDKEGMTALHHAAQMGRAKVASYLISQGLSVNALDKLSAPPLMYGITSNDTGTVSTLLRSGAKTSFSVNTGSGTMLGLDFYLDQSQSLEMKTLFRNRR
ncbi:MAG TPA: ankyrin repeat domain-containing protein [Fibrobacteria bacterium]|nr:ankyrin repeat domain-containing protein [Fibrobacteria bacterium]